MPRKEKKYAGETKVPVTRSRAEIEKLLVRYGATQFLSGWDATTAQHVIGFSVDTPEGVRQVRLRIPIPDRDDFRTDGGHEQEIRRVWRAMVLVVKAKLEAVASGISTLEREFMADIVLPDGSVLGDWAAPQLASAYDSGKMPKLLPA